MSVEQQDSIGVTKIEILTSTSSLSPVSSQQNHCHRIFLFNLQSKFGKFIASDRWFAKRLLFFKSNTFQGSVDGPL